MQYIILDLEWNQPWPGSQAALTGRMRGEIVQIGAVRMLEDQSIYDEFQILVRPRYYRKMNSKVAKLTGIRDSVLREKGVGFAEAMARFECWCGVDCVFLTWGFDDITILKENLAVYRLDDRRYDRWYNAQMIFNAQTDGSSNQKALSTALAEMGIEPSRQAHDALGDAYHTAEICRRLRLQEGIEAYEQALLKHENGFHGAELPNCVQRSVHHGFTDKTQAISAMSVRENVCPICGAQMSCGRWYPQPGKRYLAKTECETDGAFYVRLRLIAEEEGIRVNRLVYDRDSEVARTYDQLTAKPRRRRKKPVSREPKAETEG